MKIRILLVSLALAASFPVRAEFTCSVKLEGTAEAGVERSGTISWKNDGPALAAPLVRISAGDGVVVRLTANDAWASSIEFLATSSGLPPSRLHAQESGSLPFLFRSATTDGKLELSYTTASAEPFPWTEIGDSLKPSTVSDEAWSFALKTLKARLGTTWDSYLARFRADVDLFARNGCFERRMERLMQYELSLALGTDSVIPALAEAQDAARSARGLGLVLTRTYPSSVSARFASGMFGYGWTDNLSTVAELTDAKTLVFRTPGGVSCTFTKASGSWQPEDVRDKTRLTETAATYVLAYQSGTVQTFAKANMRTASIADSSGNQLTFTWNGTQLAKIAHTDGQLLTFVYANGLLASATDDSGRQTTYAHANGLLTSVTSFDGLTTRYEYHPADGTINARALTRIVYPDGTTREFAYGEDGLVAALSADGGKAKTTIARREGEVAITDSDGSKTVIKTGVTGEAYETKDALGGTSVSRYGADGLLKAVVTPSGLTSTLQHDALGRVVETTSAGEATTSFAYEETFGNLRSVTDAKGHAVTYGYDDKGRGTSVTFHDNSSSRVEYNSRGDVVKTYNRRGESVSYAYDARGRLAQKTWSNGRTFTYAYDARGNVTEASDSETGTVKMEYDAAERMTKIEYPGGRGFTFEYDAYGRLTRRSSFDGTAECFVYDARGRLASVTDGEGNLYLRNVYDETTGRLVRQENGNGTSTTYLYDKLGRTTSIEHLNADGKIVEALEYCYDVDGRCIRACSVFGEERFGYDADGQVTQAVYPDALAETFAYDAVGNRTTANAADYTVNALNQYTAVSASSSTSSATFTYDRDGNLTSMTDADGTTTYGYDTLNRLVSVKNASAGLDWSCKYDALGNRVSVTENGVTTERVYLQGSLPSVAAEYVNGELKSRHILVGAVRIADVSDTIRYLHADLIGSVRLVTDADGYTQSRATYKAFGELRGGWDMDGIDGYVGTLGVETDSTGLLFMRNRYYSPALGRFIQADPIGMNGGDENWYRYCGNDSIVNADPEGHMSWSSAGALVSGFAEGFLKGTINAPKYFVNHFKNNVWGPMSVGFDAGLRFWPAFLGGPIGAVFSYGYSALMDSVYSDNPVLDVIGDYLSLGVKGVEELGKLKTPMPGWYSNLSKGLSILEASSRLMLGIAHYWTPLKSETIELDGGTGGGNTPGGGGGDTPGGGGTIMNEKDWIKIATNVNAGTATYSLGADIRLEKLLSHIHTFSGRLIGNGHKLTLADEEIFYIVDGANFENVTLIQEKQAWKDAKNCKFSNVHFGRGYVLDVKDSTFTSCVAESGGQILESAEGCEFIGCTVVNGGCLVLTARDCQFAKCVVVNGGHLMGSASRCNVIGCEAGNGDIVDGGASSTKFENCKSTSGSIASGVSSCEFVKCDCSGADLAGGANDSIFSECTVSEGSLVTYSSACQFGNCIVSEGCLVDGDAGSESEIVHCTVREGNLVSGFATDCKIDSCKVTGGKLAARAENCMVKNCRADYSGPSRGAIANVAIGSSFENCSAKVGIKVVENTFGQGIGGLIGSVTDCTLTGCSTSGSVEGDENVGGLVGKAFETTITDCQSSCRVCGSQMVGGFIGTMNSNIREKPCVFTNCKATGPVFARSWAGGFVGSMEYSTVRNCSATGAVTEDLTLAETSADNCFLGGFVGHVSVGSSTSCLLENCVVTGNVSAQSADDVGGFAGLFHGTSSIRPQARKCSASGAVVGGNNVGGFAGSAYNCNLEDCVATGAVTAYGNKLGQLYVGGLNGDYRKDIGLVRCFASGKVTAEGSALLVYTGGLIPLPMDAGTMAMMGSYASMLMIESTDCYWDVGSTGQKYSAAGTGLTSANAKKQSSFSGWDFNGTWQMVDGRPMLTGAGANLPDLPPDGGDENEEDDENPVQVSDMVDPVGEADGCSVSGEGTYEAGETVKLTAMPAADCLFDGWYADAACTMLVSSESAWSFVVEDPAQRYFAKFSTKASKLEATRVYCYDRYVVHKGMPCWFQIDGFAPIGTSLAVSGLPAGFTFDGESMMVCGTAMRTGSYVMTMTTASAAGTKTRKIPFVVIDADGGPDDAPCAEFAETTAVAAEGGVVRVTVYGGGSDGRSSALLYFTPGSADAKDVDLANVAIDGVKVPKAKFPLALSWGADDNAAKTVEIPVKTDKTVEGDEFFLLQLGGSDGQDLGENRTCWVTVVDETVSVSLAQAANVPLLKVTTKGDGKWIAAKGNVFHFTDAERGMYHVRSPELKPGQSSTLEFGGIKGTGVLKVYYRFIGQYDGGTPATLRVLENKEPLEPDTAISHAESGTGNHYFTVDERVAGAHTYSCVFTQGDNPDVRMEIVSVQWTPTSGSNPVTICVSSNGSGFGTVTGSGTYQFGETAKLTAKPAAGRTFAGWYKASASTGQYELYDATHASLTIKATEPMDIVAFFLDIPYVLGLADSADRGKVTGSGYCAEGKKVTLKATANKGYVFMGWYRGDGTLVAKTASIVIDRSTKPTKDSASSTTITGITSDVTYYAVYVTAEEDAASIGATVNGFAFGAGTEDSNGAVVTRLATNVMAGVYLAWPVAASALSATTVKVAGLPSGLKFTAKPVTKTTGSGKNKVTVTNVPANTIYGTPTKASTVDKYGDVKPSTVKITVTTAGKSKADYVISLTVDPIPAFAVGTFDGWYGEGEDVFGSATLTVAANGKVSGKVLMPVDGKGKTYNFKADSLSGFSRADDGSVTNVTVAAMLTGENKAAVPLALTFAPDEIGIGCVEGTFDEPWSGGLWLGQNGWKRGGYVFPNIPKNIVLTLDDGLTLTFKKNGVVTIGGKIVGDDGVKLVSAKGSAQLVSDPESADGFLLFVYVPPVKNLASGLCRLYDVKLIDAAVDNVVTDVKLTERQLSRDMLQ